MSKRNKNINKDLENLKNNKLKKKKLRELQEDQKQQMQKQEKDLGKMKKTDEILKKERLENEDWW